MEEALLMLIELGLEAHVYFGLSADEGFLKLVVKGLGVALKIGFSSGLFLFGFDVVEFVDIEVLLAAFVHRGGDEAFFELRREECRHGCLE